MWPDLIDIAACINCGGRLETGNRAASGQILEGALSCASCGAQFAIGGGITRFGSPEGLDGVADHWPGGRLTQELLERNVRSMEQSAQCRAEP